MHPIGSELKTMDLSGHCKLLREYHYPHLATFGRLLLVRKTANNTLRTSQAMMALIDEHYANAGTGISGTSDFPEPKYAFWRYLERHSPLSLEEARRVVLKLETDALWHKAIESTFEEIDELTGNADYTKDAVVVDRLHHFHEQWISMGQGTSDMGKLRAGLSRWIEAVQDGRRIHWPRPKSVRDSQLLNLEYQQSKSLRSNGSTPGKRVGSGSRRKP